MLPRSILAADGLQRNQLPEGESHARAIDSALFDGAAPLGLLALMDIQRASRLIENDNRRRSRVRAVHRHASEKESHADQE